MQRFDKLFINGEWVAPHGSGYTTVFNPATEEGFAQVCNADLDDVNAAFAAARAAFPRWSATSAAERADWIRKLHVALEKRKEDLAQAITQSMGCPLEIAKIIQVNCVKALEKFAGRAYEMEVEKRVNNSLVVREAVGVCAFITPWNYPLYQLIGKVAPALATGCTMVIKPSSITPLQDIIFAEVVADIGLPKGVFNLITGKGGVLGDAMVTHPEVDMVSFTGSTATGKRIQTLAADSVKRVCLELGGKSPFIITENAPLEQAVSFGVKDVMINTGQTCIALTRMLVPASKYEEATQIAKQVAESLKVGDPFDKDTYVGPMSSMSQRETVLKYIQQGLDEGAKLVTGGLERPTGLNHGAYVKPTIFRDVHNKMTIAQEEIFGPVICMIPYNSLDEAIAIANDSIYGLSSGVWAGTQEEAIRIARQIRAGGCYVNGGDFNYDAPLGGYKQSGNGREWGEFGIHEFYEIKSMQL
ncbi:aldehyde dehydrogenase family protein [Chitinimonas sp. BJB300]|uniref:aldehyde dehydrogenase family protein n=1 Tax=Chitinimonas sp. BJB300 TaxID=1559339 RepID=UPI000C0F1D94|nr:aldehyde dehydrogenase family protein [Chitinimonas sp. BJB300]PHV12545.1 aldehyde dehydrogenase family protein [Chitinimonas sp. BJB300]TSJ90059.1 aldehyde dehydrogenase family protein [Chitinimonas sp. BJB300]